MGLLVCTKCKEEKPATVEFFPAHNKKKNGLDSWCKKCRAEYRSSTRRGRYRAAMSDKDLENLISTTYECVICGVETPKLVVDHCHATGNVRGILCNNCNMGLGHFKDDPQLLEFARVYLLDSIGSPEAEKYLNNE